MEKSREQETRSQFKTRLVEQIKVCLHSGEYSRALGLLGRANAQFPGDSELTELEKSAQDGLRQKAEADRLITESQDLFAQQKSAEAIQLLRQAYALDKKNALARTILANALVEHANSLVESDWLEAETMANQALALNPAHPTAKTILNRIVDQKQTSSVDDWVSQARKLQSSGNLFAALAYVAEGLAVHPNDPKLLLIRDSIQRDQGARRRQDRRRDVDNLRRMEREIDGADDAAKQDLAARIQGLAAKHWTDGEILSLANSLLQRLGLVAQDGSAGSPRSKGATVIFHVPRPTPTPPTADTSKTPPVPPSSGPDLPTPPLPIPELPTPTPAIPVSQGDASPNEILPGKAVPDQTLPDPVPPSAVSSAKIPAGKVPGKISARTPLRDKARIAPPELQLSPQQAATVLTTVAAASAAKPPASKRERARRSKATMLAVVSAAAIVLVAATAFLARRSYLSRIANKTTPDSASSSPSASTPPASAPAVSAPVVSEPAETTPESSPPASAPSVDNSAGTIPTVDQPPAASAQNSGTLLIVTGQDDARVLLNGKLQRQHTQAGQLRLPNLEPRDYVVQVSKTGFQDPPPQKIRIRKSEEARLTFELKPRPSMAALSIQGGTPGTTVFVDQTLVGTVQSDGTLSVSSVNPGDHTVELRKERSKPRQYKKHFVAGETISLAAADAALEAALAELKITFTPADARVALVKGDSLKTVSSGVPFNLAAGTYTLTARTADGFTSSSTLEVIAGQSRTLDLSLAPNGMSKWEDPGGWRHEGDAFVRKGGNFVLYGVVPDAGTFVFSVTPMKGRLVQWVFNYTDPKNYVLFQVDDNNFYRSVIRNGEKTDEIIVPHKVDKKSPRALHIRVSATEIAHQIKEGERWRVLDRWSQPGVDLSRGKFGFYIPGSDQVALSGFAHYADLNVR